MAEDRDETAHRDGPQVPRYERPGDQFPGISQNIMATFSSDQIPTEPSKRTWPLVVSPLVLIVLIVGAVLLFR